MKIVNLLSYFAIMTISFLGYSHTPKYCCVNEVILKYYLWPIGHINSNILLSTSFHHAREKKYSRSIKKTINLTLMWNSLF